MNMRFLQSDDVDESHALKKVPIRSRLLSRVVFSLILLFVAGLFGVDAILISPTKAELKKDLGESAVLVADQMADKIELNRDYRIEYFEAYTHDEALKDALISSNREFALLEDVEAHMTEIDREWVAAPAGSTTPVMRDILDNFESEELRSLAGFFAEKYKFPLYAEVFITNKFGANIAQTGRTSDFYQADEAWWQEAVEKGLFVSQVEFDESAGVNSIELGIAVKDDGELLGVMKVALNLREIERIVLDLVPKGDGDNYSHQAHGHLTHEGIEVTLHQSDGSAIYSTQGPRFSEAEHADLFQVREIGAIPDVGDYHFLIDEDGREILIAHAYINGPDWVLTLEQEVGPLLSSAEDAFLRSRLSVGAFFIFIFLIATFFLIRLIVRPVEQLTLAADAIASGNYEQNITFSSNSEMGTLARSLNSIKESFREQKRELLASNEYLEEEVEKRTRELEDRKAELEQAKTTLEGKVQEKTSELQDVKNNWESMANERTKELNEKLEELEKLNKVMVGRELKMAELKEDVRKLRSQLDSK